MNKKNKLLVFLLVSVMLAIQVVSVSAQGKTPPNPDQLTPEQMKNAVVESHGIASNRSKIQGQIYRFANCDESNPDAPCYFMVTGSGNFTESINATSITPLAATASFSCITPIYNGAGTLKATLKQNVGLTFWGTYGQTPVTLNWGTRAGTGSSPLYSWSDLTGPNPSPGWGIKVLRTQTAYSIVGGMLTYAPFPGVGWSQYISNRLTVKSSGWYCS